MAAMTRRALWLALAIAAALAGRLPAQSTTVTAGPHYRAGWLHEMLLGAHHRDLWTTPIVVEQLDLSRFAGGLTPSRCGGRRQTKSLRFLGADGREYVFRSVDKDPTLVLPPELRQTFARAIIQDQISSAHPAGPLVVAPLLDAARVLHAEPRIVTLPADRRLQPFDCVRPGMLGMIEERPTEGPDNEPGFAGAAELAGTKQLLAYLESNADHRVDARALLAARLMDAFIGDWDRHQDQWRWARFDSAGGGALHWWRPIPRDRDQAFARLDGLLVWIAGFYQPQLVGFGDDYPSIWRLTWSGRAVDRRLLVELERPTWDSVAQALRRRLTDSVLTAAVRALPPPYYQRGGAGLLRALQRRRDRLPEMAARYYALLAEVVDVHATDRRDAAGVVRYGDGRLELWLSRAGGGTYFRRTFAPGETREVRLYLHGGGDRLHVRDAPAGGRAGPLLRVIGGGGDDELIDSSRAGPTRLYDDAGDNRFVRGPRTAVDRRRYREPPVDTTSLAPPRDWGGRWQPLLWTSYGPDVGAFLGAGVIRTGYAFRRLPYSSRVVLRAGYATTAQTYRAELTAESHGLLFPATVTLHARASGIEILRFYGVGNETPDTGSDDFYKVRQRHYRLAPGLRFQLAGPTQLAIGPVLKFTGTDLEAGTFVDATRPYGTDGVGQIGAAAELRIDTRDLPQAATRGAALVAGGTIYPAAIELARPFGTAHAEAMTYLTAPLPLSPTLALRVGGKKVWGTYPLHEAAFVGGWSTVRGFPEQRFAGDAALFGNVELRLRLSSIFLILPGELGVFGLGDAGRVYVSGERSDKWHAGAGGGLWIAFLNRANTISIAAADGGEGVRVYARAGFAF